MSYSKPEKHGRNNRSSQSSKRQTTSDGSDTERPPPRKTASPTSQRQFLRSYASSSALPHVSMTGEPDNTTERAPKGRPSSFEGPPPKATTSTTPPTSNGKTFLAPAMKRRSSSNETLFPQTLNMNSYSTPSLPAFQSNGLFPHAPWLPRGETSLSPSSSMALNSPIPIPSSRSNSIISGKRRQGTVSISTTATTSTMPLMNGGSFITPPPPLPPFASSNVGGTLPVPFALAPPASTNGTAGPFYVPMQAKGNAQQHALSSVPVALGMPNHPPPSYDVLYANNHGNGTGTVPRPSSSSTPWTIASSSSSNRRHSQSQSQSHLSLSPIDSTLLPPPPSSSSSTSSRLVVTRPPLPSSSSPPIVATSQFRSADAHFQIQGLQRPGSSYEDEEDSLSDSTSSSGGSNGIIPHGFGFDRFDKDAIYTALSSSACSTRPACSIRPTSLTTPSLHLPHTVNTVPLRKRGKGKSRVSPDVDDGDRVSSVISEHQARPEPPVQESMITTNGNADTYGAGTIGDPNCNPKKRGIATRLVRFSMSWRGNGNADSPGGTGNGRVTMRPGEAETDTDESTRNNPGSNTNTGSNRRIPLGLSDLRWRRSAPAPKPAPLTTHLTPNSRNLAPVDPNSPLSPHPLSLLSASPTSPRSPSPSPLPPTQDDPSLKFTIDLNKLTPFLFQFSRFLSVVPALVGMMYCLWQMWAFDEAGFVNEYWVCGPGPGGVKRCTGPAIPGKVDWLVAGFWALLTAYHCLGLTTGLLMRWKLYYPPLSTLVRLLGLQGICWPATHLTLSIVGGVRRPVMAWAIIATTTAISRSIQIWVTSNIIWVKDRSLVTPPGDTSPPTAVQVVEETNDDAGFFNRLASIIGGDDSTVASFYSCTTFSSASSSFWFSTPPQPLSSGSLSALSATSTMSGTTQSPPLAAYRRKERRWDWKKVGLRCLLPTGMLYVVMAWAELGRREWESQSGLRRPFAGDIGRWDAPAAAVGSIFGESSVGVVDSGSAEGTGKGVGEGTPAMGYVHSSYQDSNMDGGNRIVCEL